MITAAQRLASQLVPRLIEKADFSEQAYALVRGRPYWQGSAMPEPILTADPSTLGRAAIRKRLRAIAEYQRALRRSQAQG